MGSTRNNSNSAIAHNIAIINTNAKNSEGFLGLRPSKKLFLPSSSMLFESDQTPSLQHCNRSCVIFPWRAGLGKGSTHLTCSASLRKHPFFLVLRRRGRFAKRTKRPQRRRARRNRCFRRLLLRQTFCLTHCWRRRKLMGGVVQAGSWSVGCRKFL